MSEERVKPVILLQYRSISKANIKLLRDNGLCVVECKDPTKVRFMDPPPMSYSVQELAAIELARGLLRDGKLPGHGYNVKAACGALYAEILLRGDPLARVPLVEGYGSETDRTAQK